MKNNNLSRLQARIGGKSASGRNTALYVSNECNNLLHFRINDEDIFVEWQAVNDCLDNLFENACYALAIEENE